MKGAAVAGLLIGAILIGAGVGYLTGSGSVKTVTSVSTISQLFTTSYYSLAVYEETCSISYGPPPVNYYLGTRCEAPNNPVSMPETYNLATVDQSQNGTVTTLREAYFAVFSVSGQVIRVSYNSTSPVDLYVYFDNRTSFNASALANEADHHSRSVGNAGGFKTDDEYLQNNYSQNGWYIFQILGGQLGQAAVLTFNIQPVPAGPAYTINGLTCVVPKDYTSYSSVVHLLPLVTTSPRFLNLTEGLPFVFTYAGNITNRTQQIGSQPVQHLPDVVEMTFYSHGPNTTCGMVSAFRAQSFIDVQVPIQQGNYNVTGATYSALTPPP
jgi:hypothetical protein